jgi:2,3-bisphosphoglycerate-dependent phosphoglycerate mutase
VLRLATLDSVPDLVLLRHGESTWNAENRFTGWIDVDLTAKGEQEARQAGLLLAEEAARGLALDVVHTSVLTRSVRTANLALDTLGRVWLPVRRHWRLNERHYGALQGLDKKETTAQYGKEQVMKWRRSYDVPPPPLTPDDPTHPVHDERYRHVPAAELPDTECLADVVRRMLPSWRDAIAPDLRTTRGVFVVAHGNSIRALVKVLKDISDEDIVGLEVPTGVPWLFRLDDALTLVEDRQLGDPEAIRAAAEAVARQAG